MSRATSPLLSALTVSLAISLAATSVGRAAFVDIGFDVPSLGVSAAAWGDFDNDGDLDLALTGQQNPPQPLLLRAFVFRNDAGVFSDIGAALTPVVIAAMAWGDYDNDADLDLLICGDSDSSPADAPLTRLYRNDGGAFTNVGNAGLPDIQQGSIAFGDYDRDGDLDVLVTGYIGGASILSAVYRNQGGTFTDAAVGLPAVFSSSAVWGDYDADGDLDIALSGSNGPSHFARIYRNSGGAFADIVAGLAPGTSGDIGWVDEDNDGDLDLMITGYNGSTHATTLYRNNAGFSPVATGLPAAASRGFSWGDYDNDGDPDLLLSGIGTSPGDARVYRNDGGTFVDIAAGLANARGCTPSWGDFDADGDLDILLCGGDFGGTRKVYRNTGTVSNTPPSLPANLLATVCPLGEVEFSWSASTDAETPQGGLTYNLRVGTTWGGDEILSSMSNPATGQRLIPSPGNAGHNTTWTLNLPPGVYYWTVQAVDGGYEASDFAPVHVINGFAMNGTKEPHYGAPVAVQAVQTQFGDNTLGLPDFANGSELDEAFASLNDCTLNLMLTGNLESNFNKLELFFDTKPGGQNRLRGDNSPVGFNGLNRMGDDGSGNGLTFDFGFEPDYYISLTGGDPGGGYQLFAIWAELLTTGGGVGAYLGQTGAISNGVLTGGTNPDGILATIDNVNVAGVGAGTGAQSGAGVLTGVELAIPLSALGNPAGCFRVCAFVNGVDHDFVSNQVLSALVPPHDFFGEPRDVNFSRHDGAQSFAVCEAATVGVEEPPPGPKSRQLSAIYPNPMRASALMRFDLPAEEAVTLEVFNVQGRRVSELARGVFPAGPQYALWRGLDEQGHELPSGVYFVRLRAGGEEDVRKLMVRR